MSRVTKKDVVIFLSSVLVGLGTGYYFEHRSRQGAIDDAVEIAVATASADAQETLLEEFRKSAPDRLLKEFPVVFDSVSRNAFNAGKLECQEEAEDVDLIALENEAYQRGRRENCDEKYEAGLVEGQRLQLARQSTFELAQRDWDNYARAVSKLAEIASEAQRSPADQEIRNALTAQAISIGAISGDLETAYDQQSSSFNSIMEDLRRAVEARNYPRIRELSIAAEGALGAKGERFLGAHRAARDAFEQLAN